MTHVLYASRGRSVHDDRWAAAWSAAGLKVTTVFQDDPSDPRSFEVRLVESLSADPPNFVHAGPIPDVAYRVSQLWQGRLIAASWGFDLLRDIELDRSALDNARIVVSCADIVLVDNNATRLSALQLGASADQIVEFPWGVDLDRFPRVDRKPRLPKSEWDAEQFVILSTRSHASIYDVDCVVRGFAEASKHSSRLRLTIAGDGPLTSSLIDLVAQLGIDDKVAFVGVLSQQDLPRAYRDADIYVSASHVDGSSVSLLEAMASLTPVVVSEIAGNAQWVTAETGWTFDVGNSAALAEILAWAANDSADSALKQRALNARDLVEAHADWSLVPDRLRSLAEHLLRVTGPSKEAQ